MNYEYNYLLKDNYLQVYLKSIYIDHQKFKNNDTLQLM